MPVNPKSLKNLKPAKKGDVLNPNGRPRSPAGATLREWLNVLIEKPERDLREIINDEDAPAAKVIAARRVLNAMLDSSTWKEVKDKDSDASEMYRTGDTPGPALDFDRIFDRTVGKPAQQVNVKGEMSHTILDPEQQERAKRIIERRVTAN